MSADYIMIGGFLGAGKTTAVLALAEALSARGRRVGLITNDQSVGLVDTALAKARGFPVEEITGGCFCCRFTSLTEAADRLHQRMKPDVFIAEPVGSCTDLRASVSYPLRSLYGDAYRIAPLSVLIDPLRALRMFGVEEGRAFSPRVRYVYEKQLEEANLVVVNKVDLVDQPRLERLRAELARRYPEAEVLAVSARHRTGLDEWFTRIFEKDLGRAASPDLDYDVYADGEARLGWFNATLAVTADSALDGNALLLSLAAGIQRHLAVDDIEIAHCKMTLSPDGFGRDLAVLNLVRSDGAAELSHRLSDDLTAGELLVNLRAEAAPDRLRSAVSAAIAGLEGASTHSTSSGSTTVSGVEPSTAPGAGAGRPPRLAVVHLEAFSPPRPSPTYRMATA